MTSLSMLWTSQAANSPDAFVWMARVWFAGVFVFALRIVFGLLAIERLRRRSLVALPPRLVARLEALQVRLGIDRMIRYCQCDAVSVPAVIGMFRPIVLLPVRALTGLSAEQLDAVIAHELGHIARFDVAVNFLQVIAETLLFFHPAVWWLNKRIRADREDCCDDVAVAACGSRVTYARALATMEGWRETPSFAMAATGGTVAARVARLLGVNHGERGEQATRAIAAMLVLTTALAAGLLSLGFARPAIAQVSVPAAPPVTIEPVVPAAEVLVPVAPEPELELSPPVPDTPELMAPELEVMAPSPAAPAVSPPEPAHAAEPVREPRATKEPKAAKEPKVAKAHKVAKAPKSPKEPKVAKTPTPPKEPKVAKTPKPPKEPKVAKIPKAPKVPKAAKEPKVSSEPSIDHEERTETREIEQTDVHERVQFEVREEARLNHNQNHNQNQNHHNGAADTGIPNSDLGSNDYNPPGATKVDVAAMQAMAITPDYARAMQVGNFRPNSGELIALKALGVAPDYLAALSAAGFKGSAGDVMQARAMNITREHIEHAQKLGFKDLTIDKLIQLELSSAL